MNIASIKSRAALALLLHLHLTHAEEVTLTAEEAFRLLGITRNTLTSAKDELIQLGLVSVERRPHGLVYRLLAERTPEMVEPEPEPEIDPLEARAYQIDQMDTTGSVHQPYSPYARRRKKLMMFVNELMAEFLPNEKPFGTEQARILADAAEKNGTMGPAALLLLVVRRYAAVGDVERTRANMCRYLLRIVQTEGNERARPAPEAKKPPWMPATQDFRTEEEAREYWKGHPDPAFERLKKLREAGRLKAKRRNWLDEEDTDGSPV